jgi:hypothetical protein
MKTITIEDELKSIKKSNNGILRPIDVVLWAEKHPKSLLYGKFNWDDASAGHQFRLIQARHIINVRVTTVKTEQTRMFVSVQSQRSLKDGGYHSIEDVLDDPNLYAETLKEAKQELVRIRNKYRHIVELKAIWNAIDDENQDQAG